jgi:hypothetical protein
VSGSTQGRTVQARTALIARRGGPIHSRTINLCVLTSAIALDGNRGIHRPLFNRCQWLEGVRAPQRFDELPRHDRWGVAGHPRSRHPTPHPSRTRHRNPAESDWLPGWCAANAVPAPESRRKKCPDRPQKIVGFCVAITLSLSPSIRLAAGLGLGRG